MVVENKCYDYYKYFMKIENTNLVKFIIAASYVL